MYFDGEFGEEVRVEDVPEGMLLTAEEHRAEVGPPTTDALWSCLSVNACLQLVETLTDYDDTIAEAYLAEEEIPSDMLKEAIRRSTLSLEFSPGELDLCLHTLD